MSDKPPSISDDDFESAPEYDLSYVRRCPAIPLPPDKMNVTIRLDEDIVVWFREHSTDSTGGCHYQTLINAVLREFVDTQQGPSNRGRRTRLAEFAAASG